MVPGTASDSKLGGVSFLPIKGRSSDSLVTKSSLILDFSLIILAAKDFDKDDRLPHMNRSSSQQRTELFHPFAFQPSERCSGIHSGQQFEEAL
jgi:hypothetical protein